MCVYISYKFIEIPNRRGARPVIGFSQCPFLRLFHEGFRIEFCCSYIVLVYTSSLEVDINLEGNASDKDRSTLIQFK